MARKKTARKGEPARRAELVPQSPSGLPPGYAELLEDLKARVRTAQLKAAVAVNREMIQLNGDLSPLIVERLGQGHPGSSREGHPEGDSRPERTFARQCLADVRALSLFCKRTYKSRAACARFGQREPATDRGRNPPVSPRRRFSRSPIV